MEGEMGQTGKSLLACVGRPVTVFPSQRWRCVMLVKQGGRKFGVDRGQKKLFSWMFSLRKLRPAWGLGFSKKSKLLAVVCIARFSAPAHIASIRLIASDHRRRIPLTNTMLLVGLTLSPLNPSHSRLHPWRRVVLPIEKLLLSRSSTFTLVGDITNLLYLVPVAIFSDHILEAQTIAKALCHEAGYKTTGYVDSGTYTEWPASDSSLEALVLKLCMWLKVLWTIMITWHSLTLMLIWR